MKKQSMYKLATVLFIAAIIAAIPQFAQAAGTIAGQTVTNSVSVNFQVGGVAQTPQNAAVTFAVDDKVIFTVADNSGGTINTYPSSTTQALKFVITNSSNTVHDFLITATPSGSIAPTATTLYDDTAGGSFVLGTSKAAGAVGSRLSTNGTNTIYIDELAPDTSVTFYVVPQVPSNAANNGTISYALVAEAFQGGGTAALGARTKPLADADKLVSKSSANGNLGTVFRILAEAAGDSGDVAFDGKFRKDSISGTGGGFKVLSASLSVNKYALVFSDPYSGNTVTSATNNPKAIPGAVMTYTITLVNGGSADATSVAINDNLTGLMGYLVWGRWNGGANAGFYDGTTTCGAASNLTINGNNGDATGPKCFTDAAAWLSSSSTVSAINLTVKTGATVTIQYQVTIQ